MKQVFIYFGIIVILIFGVFFLYTKLITVHPSEEYDKPDIILILGDDIGYSDIGPFGSEIQTPNLDK